MIPDEQSLTSVAGWSSSAIARKPPRLRGEWMSLVDDALTLWDFVAISLSGYVCALIYNALIHTAPGGAFRQNATQIVLLGGLLAALILRNRRPNHRFGALQFEFAQASALVARGIFAFVSLLLAIGFLTRILDTVPRLWLVAWVITTGAAALGGRMLFALMLRSAIARGVFADRVAIIGSGPAAQNLIRHIRQADPACGVHIVGTFTGGDADPWSAQSSLDPLIRLSQQGLVDRVILAMSPTHHDNSAEIVERLKALDVETLMFPDLQVHHHLAARMCDLAGAPLVVLSPRPIRNWGSVVKTSVDRLVSALALLVLAPLLGLIALAIKLDSPGPVIFRQCRHGRNNTEIEVWKFRTMQVAQSEGAATLKQTRRNDPRITRVGKFLRETSLDELPQLFNVLGGSMSLVGPRPHAVVMRTEDMLGQEIIAAYPQRHRVRPGITGWAQIRGHRGATETAEQVRQRVEHDIYYIENWSLLLDLKILLITPLAVMFRRGNAF